MRANTVRPYEKNAPAKTIRHCEERSDVAIRFLLSSFDSLRSLSMTSGRVKNLPYKIDFFLSLSHFPKHGRPAFYGAVVFWSGKTFCRPPGNI